MLGGEGRGRHSPRGASKPVLLKQQSSGFNEIQYQKIKGEKVLKKPFQCKTSGIHIYPVGECPSCPVVVPPPPHRNLFLFGYFVSKTGSELGVINPSTQKAEADGSLSLKLAWFTE